MGCGDSKVQVTRPGEARQSGWGEEAQPEKGKKHKSQKSIGPGIRDGSAMSKGTMDSGVGFEDEPVPDSLPGTVADRSSSRDRHGGLNTEGVLLNGGFISQQGSQQERERQKSSDILEELRMQGIIQTQTKFVKNGEAFDVMMAVTERPLKKPPAKLEKLKTKKKKKNHLTKEDIDNKIRAAEERRKTKEEELKKRLRTDRPFPVTSLQTITEYKVEEYSMLEEEQQATARSQPRVFDMDNETEPKKPLAFLETHLDQEERNGHFEDIEDLGALEADETFNHKNDTSADSANDMF